MAPKLKSYQAAALYEDQLAFPGVTGTPPRGFKTVRGMAIPGTPFRAREKSYNFQASFLERYGRHGRQELQKIFKRRSTDFRSRIIQSLSNRRAGAIGTSRTSTNSNFRPAGAFALGQTTRLGG